MYRILKRILDLIISGISLVILFPLFLVFVILLRFSGEGEIFYLQKRIGLKNEYFNIIKFATMLKNSINMGSGSITLKNDPRVTPVGKFLRKSKINELPQIFNVLRGDMSIVGPRPLVDQTFNAYSSEVQSKIYDSKPGLTGLGSIVFRDEEKIISSSEMEPHSFYKENIAPYKGALELHYKEIASLWVDIKIIFLTAWYILFSDSNLIDKLFKNLPEKPEILKS